jgi:hypothetical protein
VNQSLCNSINKQRPVFYKQLSSNQNQHAKTIVSANHDKRKQPNEHFQNVQLAPSAGKHATREKRRETRPSQITVGLGFILIGCIEWFSIECRKTKTKSITYQLDYSANLKP